MVKKGVGADSSHLLGLGWCGNGLGSNTAVVDVKDGKILRTRQFDFFEAYTPEELNAWKVTVGDKVFEGPRTLALPPLSIAYKKRVTSKNRILYPMKRVDWDPNGERHPENRGKSKFERISWDEALDIIAAELHRQYDVYGPGSILVQQDGHGETKLVHGPHGCMSKLFELMGGVTLQCRQPDSWEGWYWGAVHVWDAFPTGEGIQCNLFKDVSENTELMLCWGCDQETTPWGWGGQVASQMTYWFKDLGIQMIYICPDLNYAAGIHADRWIPVYPNTDLALQFAIAYVWITEGLYDKEYVETHTVGFDWLEWEVMGGENGVVKTPEWAEGVCGVPARLIRALARKWHKQATTVAHCNGGGYIRSAYSHEPARMEVCLLAMQGLGKPGRNQFKFVEWGLYGADSQKAVPPSVDFGTLQAGYNGAQSPFVRFIPKTLIPKGIRAKEPFTWMGIPRPSMPRENQFNEYRFPMKDGDPYLHMIWTDCPCWTTCWNGGNDFIDALRSPEMETVVAQHPWFENDCLFADLLLPINTKYEERDIASEFDDAVPNVIYLETQCIEPLGESKSDWETACAVAERVGLLEEYTGGRDVEACIKDAFEGSGAPNFISYEKFKEQEYLAVPFMEGWEDIPAGYEPFCKDPQANPLTTPSGLLEIYSTSLAERFPDDVERLPYPHFIDEGPSHKESRLGERGKDYPLLMVSNHPRWRVHAQMDDITWLREVAKITGEDGYQYEPVWVHPSDAARYGIQDGDVVKIYNERGWTLGAAVLTERIMPGAISQDHGARLDPCEPGVSDRAGANNLICPTNVTSKYAVGEVTNGFLVNIEKADLDALRREFPETFGRTLDEGEGVSLSNWVVKE